MEMKRYLKGGSLRAQMMSSAVLLIFVFMLAELFAFVALNISYNSAQQSLAISTSSGNLGQALRLGAADFAYKSLQNALGTLAYYEYNASLRRGNFITNLSYEVSRLVINGTIANATSAAQNSISAEMSGSTLRSYNSNVLRSFNLSLNSLSINETVPVISQSSPYSISIGYLENVVINASGNLYRYSFPVNATVQLNGLPDLFYAQQGALSYMRFANMSNLTYVVGNAAASAGSTFNFAYGTVYSVPAGGACPGISAPLSYLIIIATHDATGMANCYNSFAGLITDRLSGTPTVPYLLYSNGNVGQLLRTGESVLLYGPQLETLNIESLRGVIANGYYLASQFAPSYMDRSSASLAKQSQNGIVAFDYYNRQVAGFPAPSSISGNLNPGLINLTSGAYTTVAFWVYWNGVEKESPFEFGNYELVFNKGCFGFSTANNNPYGVYDYGLANRWLHVVAMFYNGQYNGNARIYINGVNQTIPCQGPTSNNQVSTSFTLGGSNGGTSFVGDVANLQIYNRTLSQQAIYQLYSEGISSVPLSGSGLALWWPLNGNANDYSGNNENGTSSGVAYTKAQSGPSSLQVPNFNGQSSMINTPLTLSNSSSSTVVAWVNPKNLMGGGGAESIVSGLLYTHNGNSDLRCDLGGKDTASGASIPSNNWTLVACTYDGNNVNIYINSTLQFSKNVNAKKGSSGVVIGYSSGSQYWNGLIADVELYGSALTANQIAQLYSAGASGAPIQHAGLIAWWPLNGNANDYSGNGNTGTPSSIGFTLLSGSARDTLLGGVPLGQLYPLPGLLSCSNIANCHNASLQNLYLDRMPLSLSNRLETAGFNGRSSFATIPNAKGIDGMTNSVVTASAWVYTKNRSTSVIFSAWNSSTGSGYQFLSSNGYATLWSNTGGLLGDSTKLLGDGAWHDMAGVWSGNGYTLYVDGVQIASGAGSFARPNSNNQVGAQCKVPGYSGCSLFFNGLITNLQVYNASLSANQIQALYQEGINGGPIQSANLSGWWPLSSDCNDRTGYRNNCMGYQNVTYPYFSGLQNVSGIANEWQSLGFGSPPP